MTPTQEQLDLLTHAAWRAADNSYAPISNFPVGAAILTASGEIVRGCNVENEAESVIMCAERTALLSARGQGLLDKKAVAVAVACVAGDPEQIREATPCGGCRQAMIELCEPEALVVIAGKFDEGSRAFIATKRKYTVAQLAPDGFVIGDHDASSLLARPNFPALQYADPRPPVRLPDAWGRLIPSLNKSAIDAASRSYLRFTKTARGAAVFTSDGTVVMGSFVENSSTGLSVCAERSALFAAQAQDLLEKAPIAISVASITETGVEPKHPCGSCREVIRELAPHATISIIGGPVYSADKLLPSISQARNTPTLGGLGSSRRT